MAKPKRNEVFRRTIFEQVYLSDLTPKQLRKHRKRMARYVPRQAMPKVNGHLWKHQITRKKGENKKKPSM